jgi:hypothetical protein
MVYFALSPMYGENLFRCQYRKSCTLFLRIMHCVCEYDDFSVSIIQKCIIVFRQLA